MQMASRDKPFWRSRWWMPLFSLALGAAIFAAFAIGGDAGQGALSFAVMAAVAALFYFGGRSETLRGLGGPAATSAGRRSTCAPRRSPASS
jgi:hypothetical protein